MCAGLYIFVCSNPGETLHVLQLFDDFLFALLYRCCYRIMASSSHRASSSQALYYVAATVQQQSHSKFASITSTRVLALHMAVIACHDTLACGMSYEHEYTAAVTFQVNNTW